MQKLLNKTSESGCHIAVLEHVVSCFEYCRFSEKISGTWIEKYVFRRQKVSLIFPLFFFLNFKFDTSQLTGIGNQEASFSMKWESGKGVRINVAQVYVTGIFNISYFSKNIICLKTKSNHVRLCSVSRFYCSVSGFYFSV